MKYLCKITTLLFCVVIGQNSFGYGKTRYGKFNPDNSLLGMGVSKSSDKLKSSCLKTTNTFKPNFKYDQSFNFGSHSKKKMDHYLFGDSLSLSLKAIEFESFFRLHKWGYKTTYQSRIGFEHSYKLGTNIVRASHLLPAYKDYDDKTFISECGSSFVSQYDLEAKFRSDIDIDFFSKRDLFEFEFRLRTDILILKKMVNIIKLNASLFFRFLKSRAKLRINLWQSGGDHEKFKAFYLKLVKNQPVSFCSSQKFNIQESLIHSCLEFKGGNFSEAEQFKKVWEKIITKVYSYGDKDFRNNVTRKNSMVNELRTTSFKRVNKSLPIDTITKKKVIIARIKALQNANLVKVVNESVEVKKLLEENTKRLSLIQQDYLKQIETNVNANLDILKKPSHACVDMTSCLKIEKIMKNMTFMSVRELASLPFSFTYVCEQNFNPTTKKESLFHTILEMIKVAKEEDKDLEEMYKKLTKKVDVNSKEEPVVLVDLCEKTENIFNKKRSLFSDDKFHNKEITNIKPFLSFSELESLNLDKNEIASLKGIKNLRGLRKLSLEKNNVEESYIDELIELKNLKTLNLKWNLLEDFELDRLFKRNTSIDRKDIHLKNNPLCLKNIECAK